MTTGIASFRLTKNMKNMQNAVLEKIKDFYEKHPFPDYKNYSKNKLYNVGRGAVYTRWLDDNIPRNARVLEVGCGTGQLSNFLALERNRKVTGVDLSHASLGIANEFKRNNSVENASFIRQDLFSLAFDDSFDAVICNGVLHHTSDAFKGFNTISAFVRPGGMLAIGLYNRYGRVFLNLRRKLHLEFLDPHFESRKDHKRDIWFFDQYRCPHETAHTYRELKNWMKDYRIVKKFPRFELQTIDKEGGYFIFVGERIA